jgi:hypothetical protein
LFSREGKREAAYRNPVLRAKNLRLKICVVPVKPSLHAEKLDLKFLFRRRGPRILFKKLDLKVLLRNSGLKPLFRKLVLESRELKLKGRNRRCLFGEAITAFLRGCFLLRKEKILPHGEATAAFLRGRFLSREVGIPFKGGKVLPRGKTAAGSLSI